MTQSDILAFFFHATRCNQFSWGARGEAYAYFYCILISAKKKVLFCLGFFLVILYGISCRTKHKQNFHLPFTIREIAVLGSGYRSTPSSPVQQGENPQAEGECKG